MSEYRLWITVRELPLSAEARWLPLIEDLEQRHGDLGPVISWEGSDAVVVIALDSDSEAHAARTGVEVIADALHRSGLGDRYPRLVEVEKTLVEA